MLNKSNVNNRRLIMSAAMLNVYQNSKNTVYAEDNVVEGHHKQHTEQLSEQEDNDTYVLGYN